jgi:predicted TIM-barrel fold metal-dependent hydrolase
MAALIDFHSHFFSRRFFETLAEASPLLGSPQERLEVVVRDTGIQLPADDVQEHVDLWRSEMKRFGVSHMVSFASVPQEAPVLVEAARLSEGMLSPFLIVDPSMPEAAQKLDAALAKDGFRGALFFPAMHGYRIDGPEAGEVFAVLAEHEAVAVVHCGLLHVSLRDHFGLPRGYDIALANPLALVPAADAYPQATFVIPHFGAGFFRETLMAGTQCANICVDSSSSNAWIATQAHPLHLADVFDRSLKIFGPGRILFGTDSSVFPRGWRHDLYVAQREALGACGLDNKDRERIFGGNAARLLKL